MPRQARKVSRSGIYHIMLRGINRQVIFEDNEDRHYFLNVMKKCKEISAFRLHAFCLMSNHVHILIEPTKEPLETIFKRIGVSYVGWYNRKYDRVGHLFQDRFRSENVDTDQYYMTVLRYILQNPAKAGLESKPGTYRWSSYLAYEKGIGSITDIQFALELFGSRENLIRFLRESNDDTAMDEDQLDSRLQDDFDKEAMLRITQCSSAEEFQQLEADLQKHYIRKLYQAHLSTGQISRLTGVSKSTVFRTVKASESSEESEEQNLIIREDEIVYNSSDDNEIW